jgi:hypothetical protein
MFHVMQGLWIVLCLWTVGGEGLLCQNDIATAAWCLFRVPAVWCSTAVRLASCCKSLQKVSP